MNTSNYPARQWQPLLTGALRTQALETVYAIAEAIGHAPTPVLDAELRLKADKSAPVASLSDGAAGLAVLFTYLAQTHTNHEYATQALAFLEHAMDAVATTPMEPALHGGFIGVGWTVAHLMGRLIEPGKDDPNTAIDEFLVNYVSHTPWRHTYDLISGLVGFGVYALERLPDPVAVRCLEEIITRLAELAQESDEGITWLTAASLLPEWQRKRFPHGYYNLGLAHGIPGIIALLGHVYTAGVAGNQARHLLEGAVPWLLAHQIEDPERSGFADWHTREDRPSRARLAWCYGDPGVATTLLLAGRAVGEPAWQQAALTIARRAAQRPAAQSGVVDAGLCHGAAGLGHLFNRMYQTSGDPVLGEAARYWLEYTLTLRRPGRGIAGYLAWSEDDDNPSDWQADPGLLTGAAGVALVLLAASGGPLGALEPAWDRSLLIDVT